MAYKLIQVNTSVPTLSTNSEMEAVLTSGNVGNYYKYTGTTGTYVNDTIYKVNDNVQFDVYYNDYSAYQMVPPMAYMSSTITSFSGSYTGVLDSAFYKCTSLSSVNLPNCSYIGENAFSSCSSLTNISIPNCSYIGNYAFQSCTSLTSVGNLSNVSYIGNQAFNGCYSLSSIGNLSNCSYIGGWAFRYCTSLTTVGELSNCNYIGYSAFQSCTSLTSVGNLSNCSYIGSNAFNGCTSLSSISIPNCSYIGNSAFIRCTRLISLYLMSTSICSLQYSDTFNTTPIAGYSTIAGQYGSIYVPSSLLASYQAATNWSYFSSRFVGV